jgi:hypothetical protein
MLQRRIIRGPSLEQEAENDRGGKRARKRKREREREREAEAEGAHARMYSSRGGVMGAVIAG